MRGETLKLSTGNYHTKPATENLTIQFNDYTDDNNYLGRFFVREDGMFDFEGDCTKSAELFVTECKRI